MKLGNGDIIVVPANGMKDPKVIQGYNLASPNLRMKSRRVHRFNVDGGPVTPEEIRLKLQPYAFYWNGRMGIENRYKAVIRYLQRQEEEAERSPAKRKRGNVERTSFAVA